MSVVVPGFKAADEGGIYSLGELYFGWVRTLPSPSKNLFRVIKYTGPTYVH